MAPRAKWLIGFLLLTGGFLEAWADVQAQLRDANPRVTLRIAHPSPSLSYLPVRVAFDKGLFKERGFRLEFIQMAPPLTVPALVNGQVDFATVPVPAALSAARGAPLKLLALLSGTVQHTLVSRPQFSSIPELGGKKIGVSSLGDLMGYFGRVVIDKYQLKDTTLLAVPGTEQRLLAVQAGTVDAAIVSVPFNFRAEQLGLKRLSELRDVIRVPVSGLAVSEEKITKNRPEIVQFLKAVLDGVSLTLARREQTIGVISSWMKLDPITASKAYDAVKETYLRSGVPTQEQQQAFLDLIQYLGNLRNAPDPNTIFDFGPVRQAASVRQ